VWRRLQRLTLGEALLVGQGSVLVNRGSQYQVLWDSAREFLEQQLIPDGMERDQDGRFSIRSPIHRRIEEHCLLLKRPWYRNFGHWLVDQAMLLSYLVRRDALPTTHIVVGKVEQPDMRRIMLETLAAVLPNAMVLEHPDPEVWQFRQLSYVMPLHVPPLFKLPAALDALHHDLLRVPVANVVRPRRLHVVRRGELRRLTNEPDIIRLSGRYGFEPVCPEELPMAEQAALFNHAEAVLGVKGAAMTNIMFANVDCRVMLLSPCRFIDPFYWDIASVRGMAYAELFGAVTTRRTSPAHDDFEVAPEDVEAMLERMLMTVSA